MPLLPAGSSTIIVPFCFIDHPEASQETRHVIIFVIFIK